MFVRTNIFVDYAQVAVAPEFLVKNVNFLLGNDLAGRQVGVTPPLFWSRNIQKLFQFV